MKCGIFDTDEIVSFSKIKDRGSFKWKKKYYVRIRNRTGEFNAMGLEDGDFLSLMPDEKVISIEITFMRTK